MEHLFFNLDGNLADVVKRLFMAIGLSGYLEGNSINVLGESYFSISILGVSLKLEENCYAYEDDYEYMLSLRKDPVSDLIVDESIVSELSRIVAKLVIDNIGVVVAIERDEGLNIIS